MCINAFFLEIIVLSFEIPQWRVFFSTPQHEMNEMSRALKKAWVNRWNIPAVIPLNVPAPNAMNM